MIGLVNTKQGVCASLVYSTANGHVSSFVRCVHVCCHLHLLDNYLVNILTKGQGGVILLMQDTNLQELKKIENITNRV